MTSTVLAVRDKFEACLDICRQASLQILPLLRIRVPEGKDPKWFFQQLELARQGMGSWAAIARRLNLNDAEISQFTLSLRHLQQQVPQYERGQDVSNNQLIAALRFIGYLELLRNKQPLLNYSTDIPGESNDTDNMARRQIRALDLMLKQLISSTWGSQTKLVNQLKIESGADSVRRWLKNAERGDILSGMRFGEIAQLVVDKKEYASHYATLYQSMPQLSLFIDQRKTLQTFLDDIRQIRNELMEQRPLTDVQLHLLNHYFYEISTAIQKACDDGRLQINPRALLACDENELDEYIAHSRKKYAATGGDAEEIKDVFERHNLNNTDRSRDVADTASVALWAMVGVGIIGIVIFVCAIVSDMNNPAHNTTPLPAATSVMAAEHGPENVSPRDRLVKMGIPWDENSLRSAIERGDVQIIRLFMQGGMNWKVSWTESALAADYRDALSTLLQYRSQMDEVRPCRRMTNSFAQAMKDGQSLTSKRQEFLLAFCSTPGVVKRQKEELARAQQRLVAQQKRMAATKAQNGEGKPGYQREVEIQKAIYDAMR